MNPNDFCAFCGNMAITDDHIPPKCLFPKPRPANLITVRACEICNKGTTLDDEYFRDAMLTGINEQRFPEAMALSIRKIEELGTNPKKRRYGWSVYKSARLVELRTEAGIYLGHAPARNLDRSRLLKSAEKCVRGLYFYQFQQRVPDDSEVTVYYYADLEPESVKELLLQCARCAPQNIGNGAFVYRFARVPDDPRSLWLLEFYDRHRFIGIISGPNTTDTLRNSP